MMNMAPQQSPVYPFIFERMYAVMSMLVIYAVAVPAKNIGPPHIVDGSMPITPPARLTANSLRFILS